MTDWTKLNHDLFLKQSLKWKNLLSSSSPSSDETVCDCHRGKNGLKINICKFRTLINVFAPNQPGLTHPTWERLTTTPRPLQSQLAPLLLLITVEAANGNVHASSAQTPIINQDLHETELHKKSLINLVEYRQQFKGVWHFSGCQFLRERSYILPHFLTKDLSSGNSFYLYHSSLLLEDIGSTLVGIFGTERGFADI